MKTFLIILLLSISALETNCYCKFSIISINNKCIIVTNYVESLKETCDKTHVINFLNFDNIITVINNSKTYPSIILAMAILESGWGKYNINNNYFGIKGKGITKNTYEWNGNKFILISDNFKTFNSLEDNVKYLSKMLESKFEINEFTSHSKTIELLVAKGYATDPSYSDKLNYLINKYKLYKLDNII
jgi:uncharacterized FlgJ-related protein